jgi:hypothetical protein
MIDAHLTDGVGHCLGEWSGWALAAHDRWANIVDRCPESGRPGLLGRRLIAVHRPDLHHVPGDRTPEG